MRKLLGSERTITEVLWSAPGVKTHVFFLSARRLLWAAALLVLLSLTHRASATERWETLQAIHWVENPRNSSRPGPCGELGAYQFRETTWRMHSQVPFSRAIERAHSDAVAVKHYEWIKRGLGRAGMEVTPYNIALAWNGGLAATVRGRVPPAARDYAERVSNIAKQLGQTRLAQNTVP